MWNQSIIGREKDEADEWCLSEHLEIDTYWQELSWALGLNWKYCFSITKCEGSLCSGVLWKLLWLTPGGCGVQRVWRGLTRKWLAGYWTWLCQYYIQCSRLSLSVSPNKNNDFDALVIMQHHLYVCKFLHTFTKQAYTTFDSEWFILSSSFVNEEANDCCCMRDQDACFR